MRRAARKPLSISVAVISRNEGSDLRMTVENLQDTLPGNAEIGRHEQTGLLTENDPRLIAEAAARLLTPEAGAGQGSGSWAVSGGPHGWGDAGGLPEAAVT